MKKFTSALILVSQLFFGSSLLANTDGMAVMTIKQSFLELMQQDRHLKSFKSLMNIKKSPMILP